jgi:hypothetical protein
VSVTVEDQVRQQLAALNPGERRLAQARLDRVLRRKKALREFPSPGHLAKFVLPDTTQTEMMTALDRVLISADSGAQRRWIISTPPQEGKSVRTANIGSLWLLLRDPSRRIVVASYEQGIAARAGLAVRQMIETYGGGYKGSRRSEMQDDSLGLLLDPDRAQQTNWHLIDCPGRRNGGMVCVGVGGATTGRAADVMILDDTLKDAKQADSAGQRGKIRDWYQSVILSRLAPGAIVIIIGTRWHEDDLIGSLVLADSQNTIPRYQQLVIPAQAKQDDPLGREPGEFLVSVQGRTLDDWHNIRQDLIDSGGERWWAALYQAEPSPPAGGVFQLKWIDNNRVKVAPELVKVEVYVDPADNEGDGDEAGIITAGRGVDGHYYLLADDSGHMTVGRWLRVALLAALRHQATAVRYEKSLSGLRRSAKQAWKDILREARKLHELHRPLPGCRPRVPDGELLAQAVDELARDDAEAVERQQLESNLFELWPHVPALLALPETGIPIRGFAAKGSKTFRAQMIASLYQSGKVHQVGFFLELTHQLVAWQESQDSPDRMDASVHAVDQLSAGGGDASLEAAQGRLPTRPSLQATQIPRLGATMRRT